MNGFVHRRGALTLALVAVVLAACGGGGTTAGTQTGAPCGLSSLPAAETASPWAQPSKVVVDTSKFKKAPPWKLGVSAGYLANSWVLFNFQTLKYEASKNPNFDKNVTLLNANFSVDKQVSDIKDLINSKVDAILYLAIDDKAIEPVLQQALDKGIATINAGGVFDNSPSVVTNVYLDSYVLGRHSAETLASALHGSGKIVSLLGIPGTSEVNDNTKALKDVLGVCPGLQLLDTQYGDYDRAKSQTIGQNWAQRFPNLNGVFSVAGQMSIGVAQAFKQAGMLDSVAFTPGDGYNGWNKWELQYPKLNNGAWTQTPNAGALAVDAAAKVLQGQSVTKGIESAAQYISPAQMSSYVNLTKPDDWWRTDLPESWEP